MNTEQRGHAVIREDHLSERARSRRHDAEHRFLRRIRSATQRHWGYVEHLQSTHHVAGERLLGLSIADLAERHREEG